MNLEERLNRRLASTCESYELLDIALSASKFDSRRELAEHLTEGSFINISKLGADALSLPCGKYMVWMTDSGRTVLCPAKDVPNTVLPHLEDSVEIQTASLLNNWDKLQRVLAEDFQEQEETPPQAALPAQSQQPEPNSTFTSTIQLHTVDREPLARALEEKGMTESELAEKCGVNVSQISRILRKPKQGGGDPGGRNPSIGLASQICSILRMRPEIAFPDLFKVDPNIHAKDQQGNRGSGK